MRLPLAAALLQAASAYYIHQHYAFHQIPYHVALRYIHTPELFMEAHALVPPMARILHTQPPVHVGAYDAVHFTFTAALLGTRHASLFASEADGSHLLLLDEARQPYLLATLSLRPDGRAGNTLRVTGSFLRESPFDMLRWPVDRARVQSAMQGGYRESVGKVEDENLRAYRSRVLGL